MRRLGTARSGFRYVTDASKPVRARQVLDRIDALRIPPAYRDVHVAVDPSAAVQAWGFDARGRRQYRYHARAVEKGELRKYHRVARLARDLPTVRAAIARDFRQPGLGKHKVAAGVVRLIAGGHLRVGSDRSTRDNHTFGTTTLRKEHARVEHGALVIEYTGKRGIAQRHVIRDPALSSFVKNLHRTPGRRLFRYSESGEWHDLKASDVNGYLRQTVGVPYTAKDFRTWGATLCAAIVLADLGPAETPREAKRNIVTAVRLVAATLGNTPAVCRKSYVHPIVLGLYEDQGLTIGDVASRPPHRRGRPRARRAPHARDNWVTSSPEERALVAFLAEHFPERRRRPRDQAAA
jgi:DNA topoisomerase I